MKFVLISPISQEAFILKLGSFFRFKVISPTLEEKSELPVMSKILHLKSPVVVFIYPLPKSYNKNINVKLSVGDLDFTSDLNLNTLKIYLTTGDIDIDNNIKCKSFILEGNTDNLTFIFLL